MARHRLSDTACKARPRDRLFYLSDGGGLRLQIRPDGSKYWLVRYTLGGKESTFSLGSYPAISLTQARQGRDQVLAVVREGKSPTVEKAVRRAKETESRSQTFRKVADDWMEHGARHPSPRTGRPWSSAHLERNRMLLENLLLPDLGRLPVAEIGEEMLVAVLEKHYRSGIRESARRAGAIASQIFRFARENRLVGHNPAVEILLRSTLAKPKERHFAALGIDEVGAMLKKLDASGVEPVTKAAISLMLLTGLRDHSLRGATWREIDLDQAVWTVPAERMKRRETFATPLPAQAVKTLRELRELTDKGPTSFVFAGRGKAGYLAENTLKIALHRLGFPVTAHGLRSTITDLLGRQGFLRDAVERQLDHVERNKVRAAYSRDDYWEHRKAMLQWLADWAQAQMSGTSDPAVPDNVVALARAAA